MPVYLETNLNGETSRRTVRAIAEREWRGTPDPQISKEHLALWLICALKQLEGLEQILAEQEEAN
jgi:hypothetical protein